MLIVYGSLYPWHFRPAQLAANPLWILVHSWPRDDFRFFIRDAVVNVALYIPLGFVGSLAFRKTGLPGFSVYGPVLLGLALSTAIEVTQLFVPTRTTSMFDVTNNVIGSVLGVMGSLLFDAAGIRPGSNSWKKKAIDRNAAFLALCWAAMLLFPLFPVLGTYELRRKINVFLHAGWFDPVLLVSYGASFFAGALLIDRVGLHLPRPWLFAIVLAIPAQFFIVGQQPLPLEFIAAIAGVLLFTARRRDLGPTIPEASLFLAVILMRGLAPFHFRAEAAAFDWIPFEATMTDEYQRAAGVLIEKIFFYGTAIWMMWCAGIRLSRSVLVVAGVLAAIEILQTHLPGRTPEITDPVMAVMLGFVLWALSRTQQPHKG